MQFNSSAPTTRLQNVLHITWPMYAISYYSYGVRVIASRFPKHTLIRFESTKLGNHSQLRLVSLSLYLNYRALFRVYFRAGKRLAPCVGKRIALCFGKRIALCFGKRTHFAHNKHFSNSYKTYALGNGPQLVSHNKHFSKSYKTYALGNGPQLVSHNMHLLVSHKTYALGNGPPK